SPQAFFTRLFGGGPLDAQVQRARTSVLDAVADQLESVRQDPRLGSDDRQRLESHMTRVRELEQSLQFSAECTAPLDPGLLGDIEGNEQIAEKNRAMSQIMALALACGLTRSFSIMFSTCGSGVIMWPVGLSEGQHYLNHTMPAPYE